MPINKLNTTFSFNLNKINKTAYSASKAISSGNKQRPNAVELMIGNISLMNSNIYTTSYEGLNSILSLLDKANDNLLLMSHTVSALQNMVSMSQGLSNTDLVFLETQFQNMISELDQIASHASYNELKILDGTNYPLNINLPNNALLELSLNSAKNSASPIENPSAHEPKIKIPTTIDEIHDAIENAADDAALLDELKIVCGENTLLYEVINAINEAWNLGIAAPDDNTAITDCADHLQNFNWNSRLPSDAANAAHTLMNNQDFLDTTPGANDFIITHIILLRNALIAQKDALLDSLIIIKNNHINIANPYIQKLSNDLSIGSAENIVIVEQRLKNTSSYISSIICQVNINKIIIKNLQNASLDSQITLINRSQDLLGSDIIQEAGTLRLAQNAIESVISAMMFNDIIDNTLVEAARKILR